MASTSDPTQSVESTTSEPVDLASTPQSLARAVYDRRAEYVRPHRIRVKIGSWNVAACPGTDKDLASWFVEGKGVDRDLATLDISHNTAVEDSGITERGGGDGSSDNAESEIRLVGGDKIGLYVLGLQEVVDLNMARDAVNRMYADPGPMNRWKEALEGAMPPGYNLVTAEQMSGLLLLVYASPEVEATISNVSTVQVGTGLFGYLGNKGAVSTRILLGETTRMVFVNCHLASGAEQAYLDRRLWDYGQILTRTQFEPINLPGVPDATEEKIGDEDFAFWLGDLNFRLDGLPGDDIRRLLMLHTRGEYDLSKKQKYLDDDEEVYVVKSVDSDDEESTIASTISPTTSFDESSSSQPDPDDYLPDPQDDPASLQATLDSLLPHDQLRRVIREKKAFHDGWREGPITFLPSYKYDVGTVALFDSSEKQRAPSWCDRIMFRTRKDREEHARRTKEAEEAKKKDEEMKARGIEEAADDDDVLFSYDPETDADADEQPTTKASSSLSSDQEGAAYSEYDEYDENDDQNDDGNIAEDVVTKEGFTDRIQLDIYTSHQRIISSDHKPIISIFTLDYDAAVPELKAKIHAEVAKELDRAENEGRPLITIVVDSQDGVAGGGSSPEVSGRPADQGEPVDFGDIGYMRKHTTYLTIANTGRAPAKFAFVEKPSVDDVDNTSSPSHWLTTSFRRRDMDADTDDGGNELLEDLGDDVTLEPGETLSAVLEVLITDISHVRALNDGRAKLEDVLVLRVEDGRDHFIPVKGTWLPTCFGRSIEELIRVPESGIRAFAKARAEKSNGGGGGDGGSGGGSIPYDLEVRRAVPNELVQLTEAIEALVARVLADESMLDQQIVPADKPGWPLDASSWLFNDKPVRDAHILALINALDTGKSLTEALPLDTPSPHRVEVVAEVLLLFLRGLTDGIITASLWAKIEVALPQLNASAVSSPVGSSKDEEMEDDKASVLDILATAPNHNISFVFLVATLSKVIVDLSPISRTDIETITSASSSGKRAGGGGGGGPLTRRSLSFRRITGGLGGAGLASAEAALSRRRLRERKFAEVLGKAVCRVGVPAKEKERKAVEEKTRTVVEMFLRRILEV